MPLRAGSSPLATPQLAENSGSILSNPNSQLTSFSTTMASTPSHTWRFFRAGGFDQVKLESGADLLHLNQLDQKLWTALACPVRGLEFDAHTLALIDSDKDGRVRAPELIAAIQWAGALLKNPDDLVKNAGSASLALSAIADSTPEGATLVASAKEILASLGKKDAASISVADTTDTARILSQTAFNGDGVIVPESATDAATRQVILDVISTHGSLPDRSGKPGIDQARIDAFFTDSAAYAAWAQKSEAAPSELLPLGDQTAAGLAAYVGIKAKVDDFFGRCRVAAYDARTLPLLNRKEEEYVPVATKDLSLAATEISGFPLAQVAPGKSLPLTTGLNPAWASAIHALTTQVITPLLGSRTELSEADWAAIGAKFAPYQAWQAGKAGASVEKLGLPRLRELLAGPSKDALSKLVVQDKAEEAKINAIGQVDRLVRYHRDLYRLCLNFVSFKDLYDGGEPAIFQAGTLYLDQRSCTLCLHVEDAGKHATMAALAGTYLAYCDCVRRGTGEKLSIVAAFTDGDSDNLMVGRNGLFYDRKGRDYDATITKIIDNPISLRQAFWSPYKKFVRMLEEQISKRAAAADAASNEKLAAAAAATTNVDKAGAAAAPTPPKKVDVGTVAALGVAFGAVGAFCTALIGYLTGIIKMGPPGIIGAIIGVILLISGPSLILAFIKLRKRNLGPILDANGWAVNSSARINVPFGTSLTGIAKLPPGSQTDLTDPFAEKRRPWGFYIVVLVVLFGLFKWYVGSLNDYLPEPLSNQAVLGKFAPKAKKTTEASGSTSTPAPAAEPAK